MALRAVVTILLLAALLAPPPGSASFDPARGLLLRGTVVTMDAGDRVLEHGNVLIRGERIVAVWEGATLPGMTLGDPLVLDIGPDAAIYPGLVNLHGHPAFNVLPLQLAPSSHVQPQSGRPTGHEPYGNRYQWNGDAAMAAEYRRLVPSPRAIVGASLGHDVEMVKWAEVMSMLGGQTTFEGGGISHPETDFTLVRNVDFGAFCSYGAECPDKVSSRVPAITDVEFLSDDHQGIWGGMALGLTDAWLVHLAEGVRDDDRPPGDNISSRAEFDHLVSLGLLVENTVILHGVGLEERDFALMRAAPRLGGAPDALGARFVWSPLSNLMLYGRTAHVYEARRAGLLVSLATDWTPSGSRSLLDELKIADIALRDPAILGGERFVSPHDATATEEAALDRDLVAMATRNPAKTVRAFDRIGSIEPGKLADLIVVHRPDASPTGGMPDSPYRRLIDASARDVDLVLIGGDPVAGSADWMSLLKPGDHEMVESVHGGYQKAVDVTSARVPRGDETLAEIQQTLTTSLAALGGDAPPPEGGPAADTNTWSYLKANMDGGIYASDTDAEFLAAMKARWRVTPDGRLNLERLALEPLLLEDDQLMFAALGVERMESGLLAVPAPPYRLYEANANHVRSGANPFEEERYRARWYSFAEDG